MLGICQQARSHLRSNSFPLTMTSSAQNAGPASTPLRWWGILRRTVIFFFRDNIPRLGAALAFYTTIAVAPLLILALFLAGFFFEEAEARQQVMGEIERFAGPRVVEGLETLENARERGGRGQGLATVLGAIVLVWGGLSVFRQLRLSLNSIWRVNPPQGENWKSRVIHELLSAATVGGTAFLLLVSLIASAIISLLWSRSKALLPLTETIAQAINMLISVGMITLLFGIVFRLLPDRTVPWRHVWLGALFTAVLFTLGKTLLGFYLGRSAIGSSYGAAGSVLALLVWCYYAAQIIFFGAEFTRISTISEGGRDFSEVDAEDAPRGNA